ncbi:enediyne antibiotic chromoprotein [Actinomadura harenae]|uniref:Neocarzinostatin n=1 Tax=Actinomadura harenae TaxID=2483351 RepID=A0A3M2M0Y2_9ACTN|nr:enediyne antibiotic chromoprotein [Actinomadura harenae]RMI40738.1 neocarzinostatin [Actinomadura harenae]
MSEQTRTPAGRKFATKVGLVGALTLGLTAAIGSVAAGASTPSVTAATATVTPSTGLADGQTVAVAATGLTPNSTQNLGECTLTPANEAACVSLGSTTSAADGTASASAVVHKTFTAYVGGTLYGNVDCGAVQCFIGISDTGTSGGTGAGALISFS